MASTRIAIATTDGITVCEHLARSTAFLVLEINAGAVTSGTYRTRATESCGNHATFVELLSGANAVICGGIGEGAAQALSASGIAALVVDGEYSIDDAVNQFMAGKLATTDERVCLCH